MAKPVSPLLGYNNNVRHKGKLYHIQTEDSGVQHPHIITHLFADGGRIIASKKTSYAEHVGDENYRATVKKLMQEQHKAMFIALRDGVYDEDEAPAPAPPAPAAATPSPAPAAAAAAAGAPPAEPPADVEQLERAASRLAQGAPEANPPRSPEREAGRYQSTRTTREVVRKRPEPESESIFGGDLLSEKSLDEVILSYLAEDLEDSQDG